MCEHFLAAGYGRGLRRGLKIVASIQRSYFARARLHGAAIHIWSTPRRISSAPSAIGWHRGRIQLLALDNLPAVLFCRPPRTGRSDVCRLSCPRGGLRGACGFRSFPKTASTRRRSGQHPHQGEGIWTSLGFYVSLNLTSRWITGMPLLRFAASVSEIAGPTLSGTLVID